MQTLGITRMLGYGLSQAVNHRRFVRSVQRAAVRGNAGGVGDDSKVSVRWRVCVAVSVGLLVGVSSGFAGARLPALPTATGKAICKIASGSGTVSPGLTVGGSAGGVKINFSATMVVGGSCGGAVTSPSGVTVLGGTLTGSGYYNPVPSTGNGSSCANFASSDIVGKIKVKINWSVTGPAIAPTKVVYKNNTGTVVGSAPTPSPSMLRPEPRSSRGHSPFRPPLTGSFS